MKIEVGMVGPHSVLESVELMTSPKDGPEDLRR